MKHPEYELQKQVCAYLNEHYPNVLYMSDTIASVKLTAAQGARNKAIQKDGFKTPDLIIFEARGQFNGLFIELKATSPYRKDGKLRKDKHLEAQQNTIKELNDKGYLAFFSFSFSFTKSCIDDYMSMDAKL